MSCAKKCEYFDTACEECLNEFWRGYAAWLDETKELEDVQTDECTELAGAAG